MIRNMAGPLAGTHPTTTQEQIMSEVTAVAVKKLREKTGLPMMDCKSALAESGGNEEKAIEILRKRGAALLGGRASRETAFGRFGICWGTDKKAGAIVELKCESAPVAGSEEFIQLADDLARQLADNPRVKTADDLLALPSLRKSGMTLAEQKADMFNRIREVFNIGRMRRLEGATGGYSHNSATVSGVLLAVNGGNDAVAKDICMHIAARSPIALRKEDVRAEIIDKEREILREATLAEGKPAHIVDKIVEGRLGKFFAETVLLEQGFVKDDKQTVGAIAAQNNMEIREFVHWVLGESTAA
jgi:elongation factor Ts